MVEETAIPLASACRRVMPDSVFGLRAIQPRYNDIGISFATCLL
jgi:hypothetical protein